MLLKEQVYTCLQMKAIHLLITSLRMPKLPFLIDNEIYSSKDSESFNAYYNYEVTNIAAGNKKGKDKTSNNKLNNYKFNDI